MAKRGSNISVELKEQIKTFLATNGNVRETARHFDVSPSTVMKVRDECPDEFEQLRTDKKQQIIEKSWKLMDTFLEAMEAKIPDASLRDVSTSYGIVGDKLLLMTGEPTSRSDNNNKNTHELGELTGEQADELIKAYMSGSL